VFDFHEKRKIKSWMFSKPAILFLLVISFFLARSVYERYQKERDTAEKHFERAAALASLEARAADLEREVGYIESARGIEEEIRNRFDVTKKGEQAVMVMDERESTSSEASPEAPVAKEKPRRGVFSWLFFWR
jgi:cell division protein FtsB